MEGSLPCHHVSNTLLRFPYAPYCIHDICYWFLRELLKRSDTNPTTPSDVSLSTQARGTCNCLQSLQKFSEVQGTSSSLSGLRLTLERCIQSAVTTMWGIPSAGSRISLPILVSHIPYKGFPLRGSESSHPTQYIFEGDFSLFLFFTYSLSNLV